MALAAVFPGQGAQSVGMLAELAADFSSVRERFRQASDVLGFDLWELTQNGPAEALAQTENTQPALLTASVAIWDVWQAEAEAPAFVAGHSLGEYSALTCAGAIEFADAVALVRRRGQLMEQAVPEGQGAMAAVLGLEDEQVIECCAQVPGVVVAANFNAPGQVAIAGEVEAVRLAVAACDSAGARRVVMLDVSGPFHSPLMEAAKDDFAQALDDVEIVMPTIPIVQNVSATVADDLATLRENLLAQIAAPVLWAASVTKMTELGVDRFAECGPGNVLGGLIKRISRATPTQSLATPDGIRATRDASNDG